MVSPPLTPVPSKKLQRASFRKTDFPGTSLWFTSRWRETKFLRRGATANDQGNLVTLQGGFYHRHTMVLKALLVCADEAATEILRGILREIEIDTDSCSESSQAQQKLMESSYDAVIVDCEPQAAAVDIMRKTRGSPLNATALMIAMVEGPDNVRHVFAIGANFVIYKPISPERARASLQAARSLMRRERRRHPRVPVHTETAIGYGTLENVQATLIDLSEEGTSIQCQNKLPLKGKVYFQFILPGHTETVRLACEIVWQDSTGRVGLRFSGVPQASRRLLKVWLQHNQFRKVKTGYPAPTQRSAEAQNGGEAAGSRDPNEGLVRFRATPGNRRGLSRHACSLGAEVYRLGSTVPNRCRLSDISPGGCYVEMPTPFSAGSSVEILVHTRDLKIRTHGMVQAAHPGFGMGVKFDAATEQDAIQQLISLLDSQQALDPYTS